MLKSERHGIGRIKETDIAKVFLPLMFSAPHFCQASAWGIPPACQSWPFRSQGESPVSSLSLSKVGLLERMEPEEEKTKWEYAFSMDVMNSLAKWPHDVG